MATTWLQILLTAAAIGPALPACDTESPSVGTTLFRVQDVDRQCWSADQLELLRYRRAFQDLVPVDPPKVTVEYTTAFIEYVHACLDEAASVPDASGDGGGGGNSSGGGYPRKLLLTLAAADALGGFLHSRLLPRANRAFYAGCIGYSDASALHELQKTLRRLLHTDGSHWRPPNTTAATEESPQPLQLGASSTAAPAHTTSPAPSRRRRQPCAWHACPGLVTYPRTSGGARGSFVIPMPFLDDRYEPSSIALPLRPVSLYKLEAPYSTAVIAKYYVAAIKCLQSNKASEEEVKAFNEHLYARLVDEVVPHLSDEKLYAAFGAVLRVLETLVQAGVGEKRDGEYVLPAHLSVLSRPAGFDIDYYRPRVEEPAAEDNASGLAVGGGQAFEQFDVLRGAPAGEPPPPLAQDVVLLSVVTASLLWLLATLCLLLCWCCSSCCRRHADPRAGFFYNVFVSIYYTLKNSLSPKASADIRPEPSHQQHTRARRAALSDWQYAQRNGPETSSEKFPLVPGKRQSPVDICTSRVLADMSLHLRPLTWRYPSSANTLINTGHGWRADLDYRGSELKGGPLADTYVLEQFHCHWGCSEHTVDGHGYAGELHLVHWNISKCKSFTEATGQSDGVAVLAIFVEEGNLHEEFQKIVDALPNITFKGQKTELSDPVDPNKLLPDFSQYWTYEGSLTAPPYNESVIWVITKQPIQVSGSQISAFRNLRCYGAGEERPFDEFHGFVVKNYRPPMPLGNRQIRECGSL